MFGGAFLSFAFIIIFQFTSCKPEAFDPDFEDAGGYVIGKERCNLDTTKDYWLIDFSIFPFPNSYGDTLILNGVKYNHVLKTTGLDPQFKFAGARVGFDFYVSSSMVNTSNCSVVAPQTYLLKKMDIINQAVIR